MNRTTRAALAGATGAITTNLLHEATRRFTPAAPRVDLLGMQALTRCVRYLGFEAPVGGALYRWTLFGDLVSNSAYFALVSTAPRSRGLQTATALGTLAGIGAVTLPQRLGLSEEPTERTPLTKALTVALYVAGGLAAGASFRALRNGASDARNGRDGGPATDS